MSLLSIALIAFVAPQGPSPALVDYYSSIRPIMEAKCLHCHADASVAFSLEDPERGYDFRAAIANAVAMKRMPPWMAEGGHQRYVNDYSLTKNELSLFAQWSAAYYPKGEPPKRAKSKSSYKTFRPDIKIALEGSKGYLPDQVQRDDYHCFVATWPLAHEAYVTGFGMVPGNARVSHHAIIYVAPPRFKETYQSFVEAEGGEGYKCLGGPIPDRLAEPVQRDAFEKVHPNGVVELSQNQVWLAHWAPGMEGYELPQDSGIKIQPGSVLIVQMHYFNGFAPNERDPGTQLGFRVARSVGKPSLNWPMSRGEWLHARNNGSLVVPAKGKLTVSDRVPLGGIDGIVAKLSGHEVSEFDGIELHSANVHMHLIGESGRVTLTRSEQSEVLLSVPRYEFGWQRDFFFSDPKRITRADLGKAQVDYSCTFSNPGTTPVYGGFGSQEEMCYNFSYISLVPRENGKREKPRP